jgi:hypothetical protein
MLTQEGFGKVAVARQDVGYNWCGRNILLFKNQKTVRMEGGKVKSGYEATSPFEVLTSFFFLLFLAENQRLNPQTLHTKSEQKMSLLPTVKRQFEETRNNWKEQKS